MNRNEKSYTLDESERGVQLPGPPWFSGCLGLAVLAAPFRFRAFGLLVSVAVGCLVDVFFYLSIDLSIYLALTLTLTLHPNP